LRHRLYARLQRLSLSYYDRTSAGSIISRLVDNVATVQALITSQTLTALTDLGTTLIVAAWLLVRSPLFFFVTLAFVPAHTAIFRRFTRDIRAGTAAVRQQLSSRGVLLAVCDGKLW
jgi:ABC-type bacteriocin/lantibiotic exporter with double-glycine peptidase domain